MFYFCKIGNLEVLKSDKLNIAHFFTTRNSILKTKDPAFIQAAEENKAFFKNYYNLKRLISPSQTHTSNVCIVDDNDIYEDTDALILDKKDIGIFLNFADCVPVIMYDTKNNAASIIHAGWRGTKEQIVKKAFYKLNSRYNSNPDDIVALIEYLQFVKNVLKQVKILPLCSLLPYRITAGAQIILRVNIMPTLKKLINAR